MIFVWKGDIRDDKLDEALMEHGRLVEWCNGWVVRVCVAMMS